MISVPSLSSLPDIHQAPSMDQTALGAGETGKAKPQKVSVVCKQVIYKTTLEQLESRSCAVVVVANNPGCLGYCGIKEKMPGAGSGPGRTGNIRMDRDTTGCVNSISTSGTKDLRLRKKRHESGI